MEKFYKENYEIIVRATTILGILAFLFLIPYIFYLLSPFIIGYIISKILRPISNYYAKKIKISKSLSSLISILTFFVFVFLVARGLYSVIINQVDDLTEQIPLYAEEIISYYEVLKSGIYEYILLPNFIIDTFSITFESIMIIITDSLTAIGASFAKGAISIVPTVFMNIVIGFISSFFFLKDEQLINKTLKKYTPKHIKNAATLLRNKIGFALVAYIKAQSILMCMTTTIVFIGLLIVGSKYSFFSALVIGLIDAIPVFGSGFILYPWVAYSLLVGNYMKALGLAIIYCVVFLNRQIFEPKILGVQIGLHPLLTLISIYVGFKLFGIFGLILGPVSAIIIKTVAQCDILELQGVNENSIGENID